MRRSSMTNNKILYLLIGPPGSGKTTFRNKIIRENNNCSVFSLDDLRLQWYDNKDYENAFRLSCEDKNFFNKAFSEFTKIVRQSPDIIIVDNTNLTEKRRKQYIHHGRNHGYKIVAVVFHCTVNDCVKRREDENADKHVNWFVVKTMYNKLSLPVIPQECDEIINIITSEEYNVRNNNRSS